ncbi:MAG TPA: hypothetical protein DHW64_01080 [Chitinophagaceae bacterium]|nr:hypothetical protein [Chitinophagaceae bacterium]
MAGIRRHTCVLTDPLVRQIEYVLPRLKYSVYINQIKSWLENFEEAEVELALDFLFYLEYIPFPELQDRLNKQLKALDGHFGNNKFYLLVPYAAYPKSNDIVMYLLSKCPAYKDLKRVNRIGFTKDPSTYLFVQETVMVFVDDFIGSGKSFQKWYRKEKIVNILGKNFNIYEEQALIAAIVMDSGSHFMQQFYSEIRIFAEYRSKIFSKKDSPFNLSENRALLRNLCIKYGKNIPTRYKPLVGQLFDPLGYEKTEALVAFDYGTPNNCLSIIWGDNSWNPIFPRAAKARMDKAREIKNEAAFYLGVIHKLNLKFDEDINVIVDGKKITLTARDDHSILVYMILVDKLYTHLQICQILGVSLFELGNIVKKGAAKNLVNLSGKITRKGAKFLVDLRKNSSIFKFREASSLEVKDQKTFLLKTFKDTA